MVSDTNNREIVMPCRYTELSKEEIEYSGGFAWMPICAAISATCSIIVPAVTTVANKFGIIDDETKNKINGVAALVGTITGFASGIGFIGSSTTTAMVATNMMKIRTIQSAYDITVGPGKGIYDSINGFF